MLCRICLEEKVDEADFVTLESCKHAFCAGCLRETISYQVKQGSLDRLICPQGGCSQELSIDQIVQLFQLAADSEKQLLDRLRWLANKQLLERDPLVRFCPQSGCPGVMRSTTNSVSSLKCNQCGEWVCFACREPWHGYFTSCERNLETKFQEWAAQNYMDIKFCPMCRTKIEKESGCNHMQCRLCSFQFCWVCSQPASLEHYLPFSLFGCGVGLHQERHTGVVSRAICKVGKYLMVLLALIAFAIAFAPFMLSNQFYEEERIRRKKQAQD